MKDCYSSRVRAPFFKVDLMIAGIALSWSILSTLSVLQSWMKFDQELIFAGEYWRIITSHFVHIDLQHGLLNGVAAFCCLLLFNNLRLSDWLTLTFAGGLAISIALLTINPEITWYMGFSGVLHSWFAAGAALLILQGKKIQGAILLLLLVSKLAWEQLTRTPALSIEFPVIVEAHLYGAVIGLIYTLLLYLTARESSQQQDAKQQE